MRLMRDKHKKHDYACSLKELSFYAIVKAVLLVEQQLRRRCEWAYT